MNESKIIKIDGLYIGRCGYKNYSWEDNAKLSDFLWDLFEHKPLIVLAEKIDNAGITGSELIRITGSELIMFMHL